MYRNCKKAIHLVVEIENNDSVCAKKVLQNCRAVKRLNICAILYEMANIQAPHRQAHQHWWIYEQ